MTLEELFEQNATEDGTMTLAQLKSAIKSSGAKFTDLSEGKYVSKSKYDSDIKDKDTEIATRDSQIENLNTTITTRDTDLSDLQKKLEEAGNDATKLAELNEQFSGLQSKYEADVKAYQDKMNQQAYEFAVREFANTKSFTSQAAKRDFVKTMIAKQLQMEGDKLIGGEDFVALYSEDNADAFVQPKVEVEPEPVKVEPVVEAKVDVPTFVASTPGPEGGSDNGFHFNFTGVRAH